MALNISRTQRCNIACCRGFTLVESLVVIAIIALLVGLAVPSLASARSFARQAKATTQIAQTGVTFTNYSNSYKDSFPFHLPGSWLQSEPPDEVETPTMSDSSPFGIRYSWPVVFHAVAPWRENYRTWINPGIDFDPSSPWSSPDGTSKWPSYYMSSSLAGDPSTWMPIGGKPGPRAIRLSDVAFTSSKAQLIEVVRPYLPPPAQVNVATRLIGACDGSVKLRDDTDARSASLNRTTGSQVIYFDTTDGVRGADW